MYDDVVSSGTEFAAVWNAYPIHGRPLARNLAANALYRALMGEAGRDGDAGDITVTYHPIVGDSIDLYDWQGDVESYEYFSVLIYGVLLPVGWLLFLGAFLVPNVKDRLTNAKQVQIMAGAHPATYWTASLCFDLLLHLIVW